MHIYIYVFIYLYICIKIRLCLRQKPRACECICSCVGDVVVEALPYFLGSTCVCSCVGGWVGGGRWGAEEVVSRGSFLMISFSCGVWWLVDVKIDNNTSKNKHTYYTLKQSLTHFWVTHTLSSDSHTNERPTHFRVTTTQSSPDCIQMFPLFFFKILAVVEWCEERATVSAARLRSLAIIFPPPISSPVFFLISASGNVRVM